ncbi:protein moonraker isoform X1, partial [Clarias magur]
MSAVVDLKTKEEKDAELDRRIEALRKKNEALMKRHQEIEEDKKKAEQEGIAVTTQRKPRAHEPESDRRKTEKENITVTVDLSKASGESRVVNDRQSAPQQVDRETEEGFTGRPPPRTGSGRLSRGGQRGGGLRFERREPREGEGDGVGRGGGEGPSHNERSRGRRGGGGRGSTQQSGSGVDRKSKEWEEKRRQNIEKMNEEMEKIAEYERGQRADGEKNPIRNFLDDPRRSGPIADIDRKEGSRRHVRNWGGLDFENVKTGAEAEKEWTNRRPGGKGSMDMTMSMTGRERAEYLRWKKERAQIDEERLARHRNATGQWRREWDAQKTDTIEAKVQGIFIPVISALDVLNLQLLFNLASPTSILNRATRAGPPGPIVIEKLVAHWERQEAVESCSSSLRLSVLSEDQLQAAVRLAKKDLHRKRQESIDCLSQKTSVKFPCPEKNKPDNQLSGVSLKADQTAGSPKRQTKLCKQVLVYTPQKLFQPPEAEQRKSPPTRDPGLKAISSDPQLSREIRKLQKELETYVQRIEQLVNKGRIVESVEPDEKRRIEIRQQEQAARSARIIYNLQQQVKEIQEDLDKLRSQSVRPTNKCRAVNRLAAAHRGAVRAMQAFIQQLSDPAERRVPVQCKELGQLIRQLSLCSAKVEAGQDSAVPEITLDILQKLEMLDLALRKQDTHQEQEPRMRSLSPIMEKTSRIGGRSTSISRFATPRVKKSSAPKKNRRATGHPLKAGQFLDQERREVLKTGIQNLVRMQELRQGTSRGGPEMDIHKSSSGVAHPDKNKQNVHARDAGFQQPTVASKLRESLLPQREASVPWIPTSPHSPVKQRAVSSRPEPRCLFSSGKNSSQPQDVHAKIQSQGKTSTENIRDNQNKTLRQVWLDTLTENRQRELNQPSIEEMGDIHRLRAEAGSHTKWTEEAEQTTTERLQSLLDCEQQVGENWEKNSPSRTQRILEQTAYKTPASAEQREDREDDALLQDPMLDNMLIRMEEIEKDEEAVRRRFAMISYSDPLLWDIDTGTQRKNNSSRPTSPQPIRLTKAAQKSSTTGDIVLQRPIETGVESESSMLDEEPHDAVPSSSYTDQAQPKGGVRLNVPCSIQKNIQKYREAHDSYLRMVSHETVGSFNPWALAE